MQQAQTVGQIEHKARTVLEQLRARDREIYKFLGPNNDEAEAAAFMIASRVGNKLGSLTKAKQTHELLAGLRSEIVNLRRLSDQMAAVAHEVARS